MNLRQMEVFRAVMLTGGVGGAAQLLHVSQPAISNMLAQAQRQLGFALFERVKPHLVPRSLALLGEQFPQMNSQMEILIAPIMVEALMDHSADLGVALQPNEHPNLVRTKTYRCGFACVMQPGHPLAARGSVRPADLRGQRVIGSPADTPYGQALMRAYGRESETIQLISRVRSSTSACWQAQAGGGIAVVDRAAVAGETFSRLAVRPFRTRERLVVAVLRNRYRPLSVVQAAFCAAFDRVWKEAMAEPAP